MNMTSGPFPLSAHRLLPEPEIEPGTISSQAIVPYNRIFARLQYAKYNVPSRVVRPRRRRFEHDIPEAMPPMPKQLKKLIYNGIPIGTRQMQGYLKFNGLKEREVNAIAEYLVCTTAEERREIVDRVLLGCRVGQMQKVFQKYQDLAMAIAHRNKRRVATGEIIVCDAMGIIH